MLLFSCHSFKILCQRDCMITITRSCINFDIPVLVLICYTFLNIYYILILIILSKKIQRTLYFFFQSYKGGHEWSCNKLLLQRIFNWNYELSLFYRSPIMPNNSDLIRNQSDFVLPALVTRKFSRIKKSSSIISVL